MQELVGVIAVITALLLLVAAVVVALILIQEILSEIRRK